MDMAGNAFPGILGSARLEPSVRAASVLVGVRLGPLRTPQGPVIPEH